MDNKVLYLNYNYNYNLDYNLDFELWLLALQR